MINMMNQELIKGRLGEVFSGEEIERIKFSKINPKKDVLSSIFESLSKNREKYAQFYTHKEIVDFILDNIPLEENYKVLDPACGAGAFLIEVLSRNNHQPNKVYGIDIDPLAINLCKLNAELTTEKKLINLFNRNSLQDINNFSDLKKEDFDIIIGNPPFKSLKKDEYDSNDPLFRLVSNGTVNSASLMIVRSFQLLKEGGYLAFVLPKNLLRVDSFSKLRKFILSNFCIKIIFDLDHHFKDVRCDEIVLVLKKTNSEKERDSNLVRIIPYKKGTEFGKALDYKIKQSEFKEYSFYPLFYNEKVMGLAKRLLGVNSKLKDNAQIFRGISISSASKLLSKEIVGNKMVCYRGDSIKRFGIKYPLFLDIQKLKISDKKKLERLMKDKIVIQNICSKEGGIFAMLSSSKEASIDTVTNIIPNEKKNLKFLIGLLNSKLSNFFMTFVIYLNSNFTMHTDKIYIGEIPFKQPEDAKLEEINNLVDELMQIEDKYSDEFFNTYSKLNNYIYKLYNLNSQEVMIIENSLKEVMSKKQNGRKDE
jgi:tRNA1(Val) A37 N6-methylase TrmN6